MTDRRFSRGTFVAAASVTVVLLGVGIVALASSANEPTYSLRAFDIRYPYENPRADIGPDKESALVSFEAHWPPSGFPGTAECHLTLYSADGAEVGSLDFQVLSGADGERVNAVPIRVSTDPATAAGSCRDIPDEVAPASSGYLFSELKSVKPLTSLATGETVPDRAELTFDVQWTVAGRNPGMRTCYLVIERADGTTDSPMKYNVLSGEEPVTLSIEGDPASVRDAHVTCGKFEG
jgi:hypothetical protein